MPKPKASHAKLDYNWITPLLAVGTNQCCRMHFDKTLLNRGIRAEISLEQERLDMPIGIKYFLWLPVRDKHAPTPVQLMVGANALQDLVRARIKTYLHCKQGHGRAPTLVAAYLILEGWKADDAIAFVIKKRHGAHLEKPQIAALKKFSAPAYAARSPWVSSH